MFSLGRKSRFEITAPSEKEQTLANDARQRLINLDPLECTTSMSQSEKEWVENRIVLRSLIMYSDLRYFLKWNMIRHTMFASEASYTSKEIARLKKEGVSMDELTEDSAGFPDPLLLYPESSSNLVHHKYHLLKYDSGLEGGIEGSPFILEFGGGYGSFCRLIRRNGHKGQYVIFDLPEFSILQRYFLEMIDVAVLEPKDYSADKPGVYLVSDEGQLRSILKGKPEQSTFVGAWSISETSIEFRNRFLDLIGDFSDYFIGYQSQFNEVNNVEYFDRWAETKSGIEWIRLPLDHLPANVYFFGHRTRA